MANNEKQKSEFEDKQHTLLDKIKEAVLPKTKQESSNMVRALIQVQMPNTLYKAGDVFEITDTATLDYLINANAVERV